MMDGFGSMEWGVDSLSQKTNQRSGSESAKAISGRGFAESFTLEAASGYTGEKGIYKGLWKQNKMDGRGIFKWASGRLYAGSYTNDLKQGTGKLVFK